MLLKNYPLSLFRLATLLYLNLMRLSTNLLHTFLCLPLRGLGC